MDSLKGAMNSFTGGANETSNTEAQSSSAGGGLGGIGDKLNSALGGGRESEKNEDYLDKGSCTLTHLSVL